MLHWDPVLSALSSCVTNCTIQICLTWLDTMTALISWLVRLGRLGRLGHLGRLSLQFEHCLTTPCKWSFHLGQFHQDFICFMQWNVKMWCSQQDFSTTEKHAFRDCHVMGFALLQIYAVWVVAQVVWCIPWEHAEQTWHRMHNFHSPCPIRLPNGNPEKDIYPQ